MQTASTQKIITGALTQFRFKPGFASVQDVASNCARTLLDLERVWQPQLQAGLEFSNDASSRTCKDLKPIAQILRTARVQILVLARASLVRL